MILAVRVDDELDAVVCGIGLERFWWRPDVFPAVGDLFYYGKFGKDIVAGTAEEDERYGSGGGGLEEVQPVDSKIV